MLSPCGCSYCEHTVKLATKKNGGRLVLSAALWKKQRWFLYGAVYGDDGAPACFICGHQLEFAGDFEAHHPGGRGLGGSKRDDRIHIPGVFDESLWDKYPFMPRPPEGMTWGLYALCSGCHHTHEHQQGCEGQLQWSKGKSDASGSTNRQEADQEDSVPEIQTRIATDDGGTPDAIEPAHDLACAEDDPIQLSMRIAEGM